MCMASTALIPRDGYYRNSSGQFTSKKRKGDFSGLGCAERIDSNSLREKIRTTVQAGVGKDFGNSLYDAASDDSSSRNRKSISLNAGARYFLPSPRKDSGIDVHTGNSYSQIDPVFPVPASEMCAEERRQWRRRLKRELEHLRDLFLRIEAREQQLRGLSHSIGVNPSYSDAQFSGNNARSCVGKEVTSGLDSNALGANITLQRGAALACQQSLSTLDTNQLRPDLSSKEERTAKANQLCRNSEFVMSKIKMLPREKSKSAGSERPALTRVDSDDSKRQTAENRVPSKRNVDVLRQCGLLLKKLMAHKHGWVFNEPVDAVNLMLSDYHLVIKNPMDLGTIKSKLNRKDYITPLHFAEDVRLTFSNAMIYNPPGNDVHIMADILRGIFEEKWKVIEEKYEEQQNEEKFISNEDASVSELQSKKPQPVPPPQMCHRREDSEQSQANFQEMRKLAAADEKKLAPLQSKPTLKPKTQQPKREMTFLEKKRLSGNLQQLPPEKLEYVVQLMRERNPSLSQKDDEIEVDIDTFDKETLWELHRYVASCMKSMGKDKKKSEQRLEEMSREPKNQVVADAYVEVLEKDGKGDPGDEDVDIDDDQPDASFPPVEIDKDVGHASRSSSSCSSSSDSGSSSDSDSGSSSGSDSDAKDVQSVDRNQLKIL